MVDHRSHRLSPIPPTRTTWAQPRHGVAGELLIEVADNGGARRAGERAGQKPTCERWRLHGRKRGQAPFSTALVFFEKGACPLFLFLGRFKAWSQTRGQAAQQRLRPRHGFFTGGEDPVVAFGAPTSFRSRLAQP